jgi:hypothetical protein
VVREFHAPRERAAIRPKSRPTIAALRPGAGGDARFHIIAKGQK